ncbi:O-antigen ligase family protein [Pseudomonas sp. N040]|uniref:O-antigen ligase family protein n=1 Tax=Pseudomonas sp. N040 TaxID=2785325 RepID=UPI0018A32EA6|nr:O-antigen ligase family protein [Pseudomonas sp. N040]MBF7729808.1 O-antigen ligase family protein [Pseudomonas sp. N040]MBW7013450.1 O-antigen ligase family protein [Pseudomonas sp. N040]
MPHTSSLLERFLVAGLLLLLLWLPLPLGSNRDWAIGLFSLCTGILAAGWALACWRGLLGPASRITLHAARPMLALLLATQAWVAVQWLSGLSVDNGATFKYLLLGIAYSLLFLLTVSLMHTRKRLSLLLAILVVSGTLQAFWGSFMTLSGVEWLLVGPKDTGVGVATGTFVNRNHLAGYLEMSLACGIGLLLALRDGRPFSWVNVLELLLGPKARLRLALVVMVIALVLTRSRTGNTAFFVSLLLVGGLFVLLERQHRLRNSLILASIILIDVLVISQYFGLEQLRERIVNTQLTDVVVEGVVVKQSTEDRPDVFGYALPLLLERPLSGQGAGSFEAAFPKYPGADIRGHFDHAHNDYLQFGIEYGLLGSLSLAAFVLLALWHALRALWQRQSVYRSGVGFGAAMGILALLIHSGTDFNLQIPANAATFVVLCAIAVLAGSHSHPHRRPGKAA